MVRIVCLAVVRDHLSVWPTSSHERQAYVTVVQADLSPHQTTVFVDPIGLFPSLRWLKRTRTVRFSGPATPPSRRRFLLAYGAGKDLPSPGNLHVNHAGQPDRLQVLSFQESATDSGGPDGDILLGGQPF
jgi:hypothetical protein